LSLGPFNCSILFISFKAKIFAIDYNLEHVLVSTEGIYSTYKIDFFKIGESNSFPSTIGFRNDDIFPLVYFDSQFTITVPSRIENSILFCRHIYIFNISKRISYKCRIQFRSLFLVMSDIFSIANHEWLL